MMTLHPQARAFLDELAAQQAPGWDQMTPEEGRAVFSSLTDLYGQELAVAAVEDRCICDDVTVRIYWPSGDGPFPAIIYFHGGGWVLGDLDTHDALCRRLANEAEAMVIAVDYRLSPETVFPGAIEDCYAALQYVVEQADSLRVDPTNIIVAGDSAGASLAAAVSQLAQQRGGPAICFQMLIYPAMNHRCDTESHREFAEGFGLTQSAMQWFWQQYLGTEIDGNIGLASPLLMDNMQGLPPAHVITAEYDVLRDEGEQFAQRMNEAGVPTTLRRYDGMIHGFVHLSGLFDDGSQAISDVAQVIRSACTATEILEN